MPPAIAVVAFLTAPFTDEATSFAPGREDDPLTIGPRMIGSFDVASWLLTSGGSVEGGVEPFGVVSVGFGIAKACWLIGPFVPDSGTGATVAACSPVLGLGPPTPYGFVTGVVPS